MNYEVTRGGVSLATIKHPTGTITSRILGESVIDMAFARPDYFEFHTGDMIHIGGYGNFILTIPNFKKKAANHYEYNLKFVAEHYTLANTQFMFYDSLNQLTKGEFFLTETLEGFVDLVIKNANRNSFGWNKGSIQGSDYINMNFSNDNCLGVINRLSEEFGVEFWFAGKTLNFSKKGNSSGLSFRYGKGNGLREITRNEADHKPVTRLFAFGSNTNLPEDYRSMQRRLIMPDADGLYLEKNVDQYGVIEHTEFFDIKPERIGIITYTDSPYTFRDSTIDFDLNSHLLPGMSAKVNFLTGQLGGYTFEVAEGGYNNTTKQITILQNKDETAWKLPSDLISPAIGDKYVFIDVSMPQSYVDAAEEKLKNEAQVWLDQNSIRKVQYTAPTDPLYLKQNNITIALGDYVNIQLVEAGVNSDIRVTGKIVNLQNLYDQQLELQDKVNISALVTQISYLREVERAMTRNQLTDAARSRLNWRTSQETLNMIFNPVTGKMDGAKIEAGTITTQHLSVGTYSQNFRLVGVIFKPGYEGDNTKFAWTSGTLVHNILEENNGIWYVTGGVATNLEVSKAYYLYFKCSKTSADTEIILTQARLAESEYPGFYTLWVGILNSVTDGYRAFTSTYGLTTINGAQISAGFMRNTLGDPVLDIDNRVFYGSFRFGDGTDVQSAFDTVRTDVENAVAEAENAASTALRAAAITDYLFTTIDGNIVATGTLLVGNAYGNNAGITGVGVPDDSVFLWAGVPYAERNSAPIQLRRNGDAIFNQLQAKGGKIGSFNITFTGLTYDISGSYFNLLTNDGLKVGKVVNAGRREFFFAYEHSLPSVQIKSTGYWGGKNTALSLECSASTSKNIALDVKSGDTVIGGAFYESSIKKVSSTYTCNENDRIIITTAGYVYLDSGSAKGRKITVISHASGTRVYGNGINIYNVAGGSGQYVEFSDAAYTFYFDGLNWYTGT